MRLGFPPPASDMDMIFFPGVKLHDENIGAINTTLLGEMSRIDMGVWVSECPLVG